MPAQWRFGVVVSVESVLVLMLVHPGVVVVIVVMMELVAVVFGGGGTCTGTGACTGTHTGVVVVWQ